MSNNDNRTTSLLGARSTARALLWVMSLIAPAALTGCSDDAYCFQDCGTAGTAGTAGIAGSGGSSGSINTGGSAGSAGIATGGSAGSGGNCSKEICDGVDNDCDGTVDNVTDAIELAKATSCGTCANNCFTVVQGTTTPTCTPPATAGTPGTCGYETCSDGYFDIDGNTANGCEYACTKSSNTETCDGLDNNCDGQQDEGFDFCGVDTCGSCSNQCALANATPACVKANPDLPACLGNAQCTIGQCDAGWVDRNNNPVDGCEFQCTITNGGVEICDGLDNDCDGLIDGEDDLSADTNIFTNGQPIACQGATVGECALPEHAGVLGCVNAQVVCTGPNVIVENQNPELCNTLDDDCDGFVDDFPQGEGDACGASNIFPCTFGTNQCLNGVLTCVGAIDPGIEICNGVDDDCDGNIDLTGSTPPSDSVGACNVPIAPPVGATSACSAGTKACQGGVLICQGSVGPTSSQDACGVDANCDGSLTNQPDTTTDVHNCGTCGNDCQTNAVHATVTCVNSACQFQGCQPGYYDLDNNGTCEYQCTFISSTEACNGQDDNCNGQIDENVPALSPSQVCGVSPAATSPECTSQVSVSCSAGAWTCTFPANVCSTLVAGKPSCSATPEVCDTLDNNCNGSLNENVPLYNKGCASDDATPGSDGACRTTGKYVCNGPNAVVCDAVKADCATLPGGCTELCDGIDNDCDGSVDEPFSAKGTNAGFFVKPSVVKIGGGATGPWIYAFEASRASATSTAAGFGNGYVSVAPAGEIAQATRACSKTGVIPWYDVSPREAEQACFAVGGRVCSEIEWQNTCQVNNDDGAGPNTPDTNNACDWAYDRVSSSCTTPANYAGTTFCNLGNYDFDPATDGDQDGVLTTHSSQLKNCEANWSGYNGVANQAAYDMTGNLREISRCQLDRAVCGNDATLCARNCCSGSSTAVTQSTRICGTITAGDNKRRSGEFCTATTDCCNNDLNCTGSGLCNKDALNNNAIKYCQNTGGVAPACRARGVACTASNQCCSGEPCVGGVCGGADQLPFTTFPLMGGSYATIGENGALCDFDFYKVSSGFKLYDTGFRCCFDSDPTQ